MKLTIAAVLLFLYSVNAFHKDLPVCKKQDGGWSDWLRWGPCSVSCDTGFQARHRYCDNPVPKYGGAKCYGRKSQTKKCNMGDCPPDGVKDHFKYSKCSKKCGGGQRTKYYTCSPPPAYGSATCYNDCKNNHVITEDCNTHKCHHHVEPRNVCNECKYKADKYGKHIYRPDFVGHACRVDNKHCDGLKHGIHDMYPANHWFFLHCSPDGPWCKPCATRGLVYNPKCGQCEATRKGECTGPAASTYKGDEEQLNEFEDEDLEERSW